MFGSCFMFPQLCPRHVRNHAGGSIWATIVPGWITAIATAALAAFAIVTAVYAIKAFGKQSQEVAAIERQVSDQQELTRQQAELLKVQSGQLELQRQQLDDQRAQARRAQASRVFVWLTFERIGDGGDERVTVHVRNTSAQPIYSVIVSNPWGNHDHVSVLMPGEQADRSHVDLPDSGVSDPDNAVTVYFVDAAGAGWRIRPRGQPVELSKGRDTRTGQAP